MRIRSMVYVYSAAIVSGLGMLCLLSTLLDGQFLNEPSLIAMYLRDVTYGKIFYYLQTEHGYSQLKKLTSFHLQTSKQIPTKKILNLNLITDACI